MKPEKKASSFSGLDDMMGAGFDVRDTENDDESEVLIDLDDIEIEEQVRPEGEFEDEENTLADLGRSLRKKQLQGILVRPNRPGKVKPYLLVMGERRVRGARLEGLTHLRGKVQELTDEEAEEAQVEENIHRLNLSQNAEARRVQRDLDSLKSVDAVLLKYNKSRAWLSKLLSLLTLPEQTNRLVSENITADIEVISAVKQVEKVDKAAAEKLVDSLKAGKGKVNAREVVKEAKDKVKPPKKGKAKPDPEKVATPRIESDKTAGAVIGVDPASDKRYSVTYEPLSDGDDTAAEEPGFGLALAPVDALDKAFTKIFKGGIEATAALGEMPAKEREDVEHWLHGFYDAGVDCKNLAVAVLQGFRSGNFAQEGSGAFALIAFLSGGEEGVKFNPLDIFGAVKP